MGRWSSLLIMKHKNKKTMVEFTLKDQVKLRFFSDKFNVLLLCLLQDSGNGNTFADLGDMAVQSAINEHPGVTDIDQLLEAAATWVRNQLW